MAVVIRLQGLPIVAGTMDIRHFFSGLTIPDGGVHIVGGEQGEAFIVFATDEDARLGMMRTGGNIKGSKVSLLLSSKTEMQNMIELSRRRFETANLDITPANTNRSVPPPSSSLSARPNIPTTAPTFSSPAQSIVTAATSVHESSKSIATFSTASMGTAPPNLGPTFCSPTFSTTMPSTATPMNTVPPPPITPMSSLPTLPTMPSIQSMSVPPPVTTLPPVPPVPPIPPVAPVPPMAPIPSLSGMPPMNPPPVPPIPSGLNGSGSMMTLTSNLNPLFLGPVNPSTQLQGPMNPATQMQINSQNTIKPLLGNPDDFYVGIHGLPFPPSEKDVKEFLHGLRTDSIVLVKNHLGRFTGSGFVKFFTPQDAFEALKRNRLMLGQRFIEVTPATERQWVAAGGPLFLKQSMGHSGHSHPPPQISRSKSPSSQRRSRSRSPHEQSYCVYLKGLPYDIENKQIIDFFKTLSIIEDSIFIAYGPNGKTTGEGFAEFRNEADHKAALSLHKQHMGNRFIQVYPITKKGMLEKIDIVRKRQQNISYNDPKDMFLNMDLDRNVPKLHAHLLNVPYNATKSDILQFLLLEGVVVEEKSIEFLVDGNGQGLGQALVRLKSEEETRKAGRLHRKKLHGRDVHVHLISSEERQEIHMNPTVQGKKGLKAPLHLYPPLSEVLGGGDDRSFLSGNSKDPNNGPPFNFPSNFNSPSSTYGPPHLPPGIGGGFGENRPLMSSNLSSSLATSGIDTKGFVSGPTTATGSSNFASGPSSFGSGGPSTFVSGSSKFGSGPSNLPSKFGGGSSSGPSNFGTVPSNFGGGPPNAPKFGSAPPSAPSSFGGGPPNAPSNFGGGPPNVPSNFGGPPSAPSSFVSGPPNTPSNFSGAPQNAPSSFGGGPPNIPSNFGGGPPNAPPSFGSGPPNPPSAFGSGPPNPPSNFSGGPPNAPPNFAGPPSAQSNFGSAPPNAPTNFVGPPNPPSNFGGGPPNVPSSFSGSSLSAPTNFSGGPQNAPSNFTGGPPNAPSNFSGGPPNAPTSFGSGPPNAPSNFTSGPPNAPSSFSSGPPNAPSTFGSGPSNAPSTFGSESSNVPSTFGRGPPNASASFGSGPSNTSSFGSSSSNTPSSFGRGPSNTSSSFSSGPSNVSNFGSGQSNTSSGFGSGPSNFGSGPPNFGSGPPNFGNGPSNLNAPPSLSSAPPSLSSAPPSLSSGPAHLNAPPGFAPGPGSQHVGGPPGFGASSGKPGPTVIKVQNLPYIVTVDEIFDFFYGYRLIPGSVCLKYSEKGMFTGEAMVAFESRDEATAAVVDLNDRPIGARKVKLVLG